MLEIGPPTLDSGGGRRASAIAPPFPADFEEFT